MRINLEPDLPPTQTSRGGFTVHSIEDMKEFIKEAKKWDKAFKEEDKDDDKKKEKKSKPPMFTFPQMCALTLIAGPFVGQLYIYLFMNFITTLNQLMNGLFIK